MCNENNKNFMFLHEAFARTEYGEELARNIRWGRYKPPEVSNERWEQLLGADVNNFNHLSLSHGLTRVFIERMNETQPGELSQGDEDLLHTTAIVHDWGEAIVGDIAYDDKTEADTEEEKAQFIAHLDGFYTGDSSEIRELILKAVNEVIFDSTSRLGRMFNAIERVGYVRTGLRANEHVVNGTAPDCEENLRWLVVDALSQHVIDLTLFAEELPPVEEYLVTQRAPILKAFETIEQSVFERYGERSAERSAEKQRIVGKNYEAWSAWCTEQDER